MLVLAASLFFTTPVPLDMPRATAYLVTENGKRRLEDRFVRLDLWTSRTVVGCWMDDDGRFFTLARLAVMPPSIGAEATVTRVGYSAENALFDKKKAVARSGPQAEAFRAAIALLSPARPTGRGTPPHQMCRGYDDIDYWHGTNESAIVCTFLPAKSDTWYLAVWELAPDDEFDDCLRDFEREFLEKDFKEFAKTHPCEDVAPAARMSEAKKRRQRKPSEREELRRDARHAVAAFDNWHVTDAEEFSVLDDMPGNAAFISALTNELTVFRRKYSAALPTKIDGTNVLCVARVFADRAEYLEALIADDKTNMLWSAGYWSPSRREIVSYLPDKCEAQLLRTFRHEAFHQYLSYATAMIGASPWLNEGYAQYFEDEKSFDWGLGARPDEEELKRFAARLPALFEMDYGEFYEEESRGLNYRLAWSVAVFLEKGAREVRHDPFRNLKADYFEALFNTQDMRKATAAAFKDQDTMKLFVEEWLEFWKER